MNREEKIPQNKDPHLDIPSEANRGKHINFLDVEDNNNDHDHRKDDETKKRQREWQEGIEEGKRAREKDEE